jgi:hypothetical protein
MQKVKLDHFFILTIIVYTMFHIPEEAAGNWPLWMSEHWGIEKISYARWLFHNAAFFIPVLLIGYLIYNINVEKFLPFGVAILFWGLLNFLDHTVYTIIDLKYSPGFFSGFLYLMFFYLGMLKLKQLKKLQGKILVLAFVINIIFFWGLPMMLFITLAPFISKILY